MFLTALLAFLVAALFVGGLRLARWRSGSVVESASLTDEERRFVERMRDVVLVGSFTEDGEKDGVTSVPEPERYEIRRVEKVGEDRWRFHAVMDCCGVRGALPVTLPMRWVDGVPRIEMNDTRIPGVGTFTVRLELGEDRYAGTWSRGERGGAMSGRIERRSEASAAAVSTACRAVGPLREI